MMTKAPLPIVKNPPAAPGCKCSEEKPRERLREGVPCEIPPFCRNHYYTGKLLTEHDFTAEQRYFRDKLRLHHRALHGFGVVCGLRVKPHPYCPDLRLVVEPGLAIDACGYEIVVPREVEVALPKVPAPEPEPCATRPPEVPLSVCLRYAECETDFSPAPFDECGCNGAQGQQPSRVCEGFVLELRNEKPPLIEECAEADCRALLHETLKPCPKPAKSDCLPLAFIADYAPGDTVTDGMIDNLSYRPLLPSTRLQDRLLRCILDRLPVQSLTRVKDIGWTHGQEYNCHDFIRFFTGDSPAGPGFEVTFEGPVRTEGLSPRSFQAVVLRHATPGQEGGPLEVAPSIVWPSADRTRFHLQIDRAYAERELLGTSFDVFVTLRGNLILDDQGRAVDGDLLARVEEGNYVISPPTGNGIPGGALESWIRVRP